MNCHPIEIERTERGIRWQCEWCGFTDLETDGNFPDGIYRACPRNTAFGPGTALHRLIEQLGFTFQEGCGCRGMIANMDRWGPDGCRGEHRAEILERLEKKRSEASLIAKTKAAAFALAKGLPLSIPELLELAIQQSEESQLLKENV